MEREHTNEDASERHRVTSTEPDGAKERNSSNVRPRIRLAQNFFRDPEVVASAISETDLGPDDLVYEIGAGEGIVTSVLADVCGQVVAVEIDPELFERLEDRLRGVPNVELINADFFEIDLPDREYKVFGNIPFNLTAKIIRRLLNAERPPSRTYLVLQREAAEKFAGVPEETQASVLAKPRFEFAILRTFERTDFEPVPSVDVVLLSIERRAEPLVPEDQVGLYRGFVKYGFGRWRGSLGKNFKKVFSNRQWKRLASDLKFDRRAQPTDLSFEQWLGIFRFFTRALGMGHATVPKEMKSLQRD